MAKLKRGVFRKAAEQAMQDRAYMYLRRNYPMHSEAFRKFRNWEPCDNSSHRCLALLFCEEALCE